MVFIAGKTVWSMPERFKVVCIPCKALHKCSAFSGCALHNFPGSQPPTLETLSPPLLGHTNTETYSRPTTSGNVLFHFPRTFVYWLIDLSTEQRHGQRLRTKPARCRLIVSCHETARTASTLPTIGPILAYDNSDENYLQNQNSSALYPLQ